MKKKEDEEKIMFTKHSEIKTLFFFHNAQLLLKA